MVGDYTSKMLKLLVFIFDGTLEPVFAVQIQNDTTLIKAMVALREIRLYHKRKKMVHSYAFAATARYRCGNGNRFSARDPYVVWSQSQFAGFRLPCPFQVVYIKFHFHSSKSIGLVVFTAPPHAFLRWNHARTHGIDCHGFDMSYRGRLPAQRFVPPEPSVRVHRVHVGWPSFTMVENGIRRRRESSRPGQWQEQQQGTQSASPVTIEVPYTPRAPEKGLSTA